MIASTFSSILFSSLSLPFSRHADELHCKDAKGPCRSPYEYHGDGGEEVGLDNGPSFD